jgi:hypothetical protein
MGSQSRVSYNNAFERTLLHEPIDGNEAIMVKIDVPNRQQLTKALEA